jgi:hypothetical protein
MEDCYQQITLILSEFGAELLELEARRAMEGEIFELNQTNKHFTKTPGHCPNLPYGSQF